MLGFEIDMDFPRPPAELVAAFRGVPSAHVGDNMSRMCGSVGLTRYHRGRDLLGVALTVRVRPGDNLMIHKAIGIARPGDVLVVDGGGHRQQALVGELLQMQAQARAIAGFVIDGAIRDVESFASADFPCYARGVCLRGPYKDGPGQIGLPVNVGELLVRSGDIVLGDADGIVAIPAAEAQDLLARVKAQASREEAWRKEIREGHLDRAWIDETLRQKGVDVSRCPG